MPLLRAGTRRTISLSAVAVVCSKKRTRQQSSRARSAFATLRRAVSVPSRTLFQYPIPTRLNTRTTSASAERPEATRFRKRLANSPCPPSPLLPPVLLMSVSTSAYTCLQQVHCTPILYFKVLCDRITARFGVAMASRISSCTCKSLVCLPCLRTASMMFSLAPLTQCGQGPALSSIFRGAAAAVCSPAASVMRSGT